MEQLPLHSLKLSLNKALTTFKAMIGEVFCGNTSRSFPEIELNINFQPNFAYWLATLRELKF